MGCLLPLLVSGVVLFGAAALSPDYAAELAAERRGALIGITQSVTLGGVNLPLAALALYLAFETFRFAWRWADEYAVWTSPAGLHFHGSLFRRPVPWAELRALRTEPRFRGRNPVTVLVVERADGRWTEVRGTEPEETERFARAVAERLGR